jgi:hypothetical protein
MQSKTSFAIWCAIAHIVVAYLNLTVSLEEVQETIFHAFTATPKIAGDSDDAITNDFSNCLRSCINSNSIKILLHSKNMNFVPNTPQIIVKDDLLMIEEKNIEEIILPKMKTTDKVQRIIDIPINS